MFFVIRFVGDFRIFLKTKPSKIPDKIELRNLVTRHTKCFCVQDLILE